MRLQKFFALVILGLFLLGNINVEYSLAETSPLTDLEELENHRELMDTFDGEKELHLQSRAAILVNGYTGDVIYGKNQDVRRSPASLTKMVTAILAVQNLDLDKEVIIPKAATGIKGNNMALKEGEKISNRNLLKAMLVYSANDAAMALALEIGGNMKTFLSEYVKPFLNSIGCDNTNFISPNGLTNSPRHYTTARDMSKIARKAMSYKEIRDIVKMKEVVIPETNTSPERIFKTTNKLLGKYKPCIGIKTGFMFRSGYCLAAAAEDKGSYFIAIILGGDEDKDRFNDAEKLLKYGFENYKVYLVKDKNVLVDRVKVLGGSPLEIGVKTADKLSIILPADTSKDSVETKVVIEKNLKPEIEKGTVVGYMEAYSTGAKTVRVNLITTGKVLKGYFWTDYGISNLLFGIIVFFLISSILVIIITRSRARKRRIRIERELRRRREYEEAKKRMEENYKKRRGWPF